jgi:hypothetical protein
MHTKKPAGDVGVISRFTAQSIKVAVPRMAKTIVFMESMGIDLITMALVPVRQSASTCASRSARAVGGSYTLSEYWAARQRRGYVGM